VDKLNVKNHETEFQVTILSKILLTYLYNRDTQGRMRHEEKQQTSKMGWLVLRRRNIIEKFERS